MERIRHIADTANPHTEAEESPAERPPIPRETYDQTSETTAEQLQVREYLNDIDEQLLFDIFAEHLRRAGLEEDSVNFIALDDVAVLANRPTDEPDTTAAGYISETGVELYATELAASETATLYQLIHEECHAITEQLARIPFTGGMRAHKYSGVELTHDDGTVFFTYIDEAITELLTEQVFTEYTKQSGDFDTEAVTGTQIESKLDYQNERQLLNFYIGTIALITDTPTDTVSQSIIRTYLRNSDIVPTEVQEALSVISPTLTNLFKGALNRDEEGADTLTDLWQQIAAIPFDHELKTKLEELYTNLATTYESDQHDAHAA